ncbi:hypothetical protein DH2020_029233 [Rehmannia glutinosa]|uniref:Oxidative stress 3 n=1 Tax=Rehmannia glutinosa TaxID=99300 RepID=A0ABR0VSH2_REHGL
MGFKESRQVQWAAIRKDDDEYCESMKSSPINDSSFYSSSNLSSELVDDASSSESSTSSGPLYELAELMAQLPIKRGLSKFYNGKSQTFESLANLKSIEDLGKKESYNTRMKSCKRYNHHKLGPKATITKRSPRTSFAPSFPTNKTAMVVHR